MFQQHFDKIKDSVQSGLNTLQQAVNTQCNTPSFIPSTLDLQKPTKSGWMKKAGGVLKGWHRKWFVLKGDYLLYYSSFQDNKLPQGVVFIPGNEVFKRDGKSNEAEKFIIDIFQEGTSLEKGQVAMESLSVESADEREVWLRAFKNLLYASLGGAIFGKSLDATLKFEKGREANRSVPEIVEACVHYLLKHAIEEEGIFRLPGRKKLIHRYADMYDRGYRPQLDGEGSLDVHSVASLLKLYLIQLPSSLLPPSHYEAVTGLVTRGIPANLQESMEKLRENLRKINTHHYTLLKYMCEFLEQVSNRKDLNKMTISNLAVVFSNIFIRPPLESMEYLMETAGVRKSVTHLLIENHSWLFNMEVSPFGGCIVVEDLLGIVVNDDGGGGVEEDDDDYFFGADYVNKIYREDVKVDILTNGVIRKSTFADLMGLDFSVRDNLGKSRERGNKLALRNDNDDSVGDIDDYVNASQMIIQRKEDEKEKAQNINNNMLRMNKQTNNNNIINNVCNNSRKINFKENENSKFIICDNIPKNAYNKDSHDNEVINGDDKNGKDNDVGGGDNDDNRDDNNTDRDVKKNNYDNNYADKGEDGGDDDVEVVFRSRGQGDGVEVDRRVLNHSDGQAFSNMLGTFGDRRNKAKKRIDPNDPE